MTDDTISRQAAIDAVEAYRPSKPKHETSMETVNRTAWECAVNCAEMVLQQLPSAQPEIVRCKECKYYYYNKDNEAWFCKLHEYGEVYEDEDFCSYGERSE